MYMELVLKVEKLDLRRLTEAQNEMDCSMEGPDYFERFVVIEFPTFEEAVACFESDAYQKAAVHRRDGSGEVETVILDATQGMGAN